MAAAMATRTRASSAGVDADGLGASSGRAARRRPTMPELQREQLVEGEPAKRIVAGIEVRRVVGRLEGRRDRGQAMLAG